MTGRLYDWCNRLGIVTGYIDRDVPEATLRAILDALGIDPDSDPDTAEGLPDIGADPGRAGRCHVPDWLAAAPSWGLFCQLYELRSARNWGIGDFADLAELARIAAAAGADFLGLNPVHALFTAAPELCSPFLPSSRRFLNPLYIAMDDLPGETRGDASRLAALRAADIVEYRAVAAMKLKALREVFDRTPFMDGRWTADGFTAFRAAGGEALNRHVLFEALSHAMVAKGHGPGWHDWPERFHAPDGPAARAFARGHPDDIRFHAWLQWVAARQLAAAQTAARAAGMRIGLYLDLAVGEAPDGSATWSAPELVLPGVTVGAPPDVFAQTGQNWHISAPSPLALTRAGLAPFRSLIEAQLSHAGALRIDHVMSLRQLFVVPAGEEADTGTHLAYPFADMLRMVAEESHTHGAVIVGEDLGWVPPGFRETMAAAGILSYRILYFEQDWGMFRRTGTYPDLALACISTHDLPTLDGWWQGEDIVLRRRFGLIDEPSAMADNAKRRDERTAMVNAFIDGGQLAPDEVDASAEMLPGQLLTAAYRFLADTPCRLVAVRLADLVGPHEATNVPGTVDEHPNWRRRSPVMLDDVARRPAFAAVTTALRAARPRPAPG